MPRNERNANNSSQAAHARVFDIRRIPLRRLVGPLAVVTSIVVGAYGSSAQEGKTYFYMMDPGPYVLEKLDGRGLFQISAGPSKDVLRIAFPPNTTAEQVKRDLKSEFPDLQFVDNVDGPTAR